MTGGGMGEPITFILGIVVGAILALIVLLGWAAIKPWML